MGIHSVRRAAVIDGTIRSDRNTKQLLRRLHRGELALISHADLDERAAEGLLEAGVKAVINAGRTMTGTFPHDGPLHLIRQGVPIFEMDECSFDHVPDEAHVVIQGGMLISRHQKVACTLFGYEEWQQLNRAGERAYHRTLFHFAENTLKYAQKEIDMLACPLALPLLRKPIEAKEVLIVSRGSGYKEDLAALSDYIHRVKPVLIGVDGGADALTAQGYRPDIIIGDMDSVSDGTLCCGAQLLVHAYMDGYAPGLERVALLGHCSDIVAAPGTSEDIALRIAYERGANKIVIVGSHSHPVDFLEKGRAGMASTLLVRMMVGHKLVDAKGASLWAQPIKPQLQMISVNAEGGALRWTNPYR